MRRYAKLNDLRKLRMQFSFCFLGGRCVGACPPQRGRLLPFFIILLDIMANGTVFETDVQGFDEPILEKGKNLCLFDVGEAYVIRKRKQGDIQRLPKTEETINNLLKHGWQEVDYTGQN
jgi:hypothetical protein